jgi:hypothetical protein
MSNADYIVVHQSDMSVECTVCGARATLKLPVEMDVWLAAMAAFGQIHAGCTPSKTCAPV